jgi:(E)-4-hydroxy-3-methylbut-2-enyl-diphosphate synthase
MAADYVFTGKKILNFELPGTLRIICDYASWLMAEDKEKNFPLFNTNEFITATQSSAIMNFISVEANNPQSEDEFLQAVRKSNCVIPCVWSSGADPMRSIRLFFIKLMNENIQCPVIICISSNDSTIDEQLIHYSTEAGALLLDGFGDGIWLTNDPNKIINTKISGRTYLESKNNHQFINNTSFSILQAARTRVSKTEYISCPSCGRTLFDLQDTTGRIRAVTSHLKGVKIAIMGCIVNGPGEMADADFGYVGSGPGKITLYKGKEIIKRNVNSEIAVDELINILKESDVWAEPQAVSRRTEEVV